MQSLPQLVLNLLRIAIAGQEQQQRVPGRSWGFTPISLFPAGYLSLAPPGRE